MESPRDEEYSRVSDPERRLDRFGVCDTMIVEWLDLARLDEMAGAPRNGTGMAHADC